MNWPRQVTVSSTARFDRLPTAACDAVMGIPLNRELRPATVDAGGDTPERSKAVIDCVRRP
ncbi:hypothetical protein GCM10027612_50230 [Microbispora bryophytorum subsp. camponoti]